MLTAAIRFGRDAQQARAVAEAIAQEAFHHVSYFEGGFRAIQDLVKR
jgi:hypothetical protein